MQLAEGGSLSYEALHQAGLEDHYARIVHGLALKGKLTREQLNGWLERATKSDPREQRALRDELRKQGAPPVVSLSAVEPASSRAPRRKKADKQVALVSRGNHKLALKAARSYGLSPRRIPEKDLRPGQSEEAHRVEASEKVASKLITTGNWTTR